MGKKLYTKENISKAETEWLGIPELVVLKTNRDDVGLEVIHRRYFEDEKLLCPACRSSRTRCSKIVDRKLKDLLWLDEYHKTFQIISLLFHQRYMRCDSCGQSVFPEPTEFGEKGCKFTNRLSDALADGTFQFSYKKVCQHYGVPASTASVGEVMRRRIQYRESLLPPIRTPHIISIVEVVFFGEFYPAVLGIWDGEVYCLDILRDSSEETCGAFLKTLDANQVETISSLTTKEQKKKRLCRTGPQRKPSAAKSFSHGITSWMSCVNWSIMLELMALDITISSNTVPVPASPILSLGRLTVWPASTTKTTMQFLTA